MDALPNNLSNHKPNGDFAKGNLANPTGKNGHIQGWQPIRIRLQKWLEMSWIEIGELCADEKKLLSLSTIDVICVKMIADGITAAPKDRVKTFKEINDRIEGTPKQTIQVTDNRIEMPESVENMTNAQIDERFKTLANRP